MKKVLVLEDESSIRSFIVINLRRAGYEVVEAETGEEALEKLKIPQRCPEWRCWTLCCPVSMGLRFAAVSAPPTLPSASLCLPHGPRKWIR